MTDTANPWTQGDIAWFRFAPRTGDDFCPFVLGFIHQRVRVVTPGPDSTRVLFADGAEETVFTEDLFNARDALVGGSIPSSQKTPNHRQETWLPGEVAWFEYHCNEATDSPDAPAWFRSHQKATVVTVERPDPAAGYTAAERAEGGVPLTYRVRFEDGLEWSAFEDELFTSREGFYRPEPPRVVRDEPVDLAGFAALTGLTLQTVRTYRKDGRLPEPEGTFGKVAWWYSSTVQVWLATRPGRWPQGGRA